MRLRRILLCAALVLGFTTTVTWTPIAAADTVDCHFHLTFKGHRGLIIDSACGLGRDGNLEARKDILVGKRPAAHREPTPDAPPSTENPPQLVMSLRANFRAASNVKNAP